MNATPKPPRRRRDAHGESGRGRALCPLCRKYAHFNAETVAAFREADEDERHFRETGEHLLKPQSLDEFFAEVNAL